MASAAPVVDIEALVADHDEVMWPLQSEPCSRPLLAPREAAIPSVTGRFRDVTVNGCLKQLIKDFSPLPTTPFGESRPVTPPYREVLPQCCFTAGPPARIGATRRAWRRVLNRGGHRPTSYVERNLSGRRSTTHRTVNPKNAELVEHMKCRLSDGQA